MKKVKITIGLAAVAAAFTLAVATTPNAIANQLWRDQPGETLVSPADCETPSSDYCANLYTDNGTFIRQVDAEYTGE